MNARRDACRDGAVALALVGVAALSTSCRSDSTPPDQWPISKAELLGSAAPTVAANGEATYRRYCIACHGADGRGNGGLTGADFRATPSVLEKADADLLTSVRDGKRGATAVMPAHKALLADADIVTVVGWVRQRFGPTAPR